MDILKIQKALGKKLREAREIKELKIGEVSVVLNISQRRLKNIEQGKDPRLTLKLIASLCFYYKIQVEDVFDRQD